MAVSSLLEPPLLRRLEGISLLVRRAVKGQMGGERRSVSRGRSPEFADFRNYTPGDDYRLIDWNAYARLDRFMLRLFVAEEELPLSLFVDLSGSPVGRPRVAHPIAGGRRPRACSRGSSPFRSAGRRTIRGWCGRSAASARA